MGNVISQWWLPLMLGVILYGLELIRRELAEIRRRLEEAFPTPLETRLQESTEDRKAEESLSL